MGELLKLFLKKTMKARKNTKLSEFTASIHEVKRKFRNKIYKDKSINFVSRLAFDKMESALLNSKIYSKKFSRKKAHDIVFHMHDWITSLGVLVSYYKDPDKYSEDEIRLILSYFLVDAPEHIIAATKLYTGFDVTDVFGVGAGHSLET